MSRIFRATALLILLAACGGGYNSAPRNLNDACAILDERPRYLRDMKKAQRKWRVPVHVQMAILYQESKFIGNARTPLRYALGVIPMGRASSAYGYSQALDGTWDEYRDSHGGRGAKRDDFQDAVDFMGWYMDETTRTLGISIADARNQYLAYHEGRAGYARQSYLSKPWLIRVADAVGDRADMYRNQLLRCGKI
ncbi:MULTISPECIES: lytic transglycosylase [Halocynthiibacter]|uniref:Lytic transglycosylase n=1 Tax=Halocynthiibacter halioticoli TaxID=2986804 RepID=A0AAE3LTT3_9RHOB|nr:MULTISPECIES: lytic transglycosylase [Halocynthiibacter]MCV6825716.1 lytic transglycosylase [Halocynthiibacter halioticoli]MCW4058717.1 lytic transglycosylase [Halocynthiibacter sp. SDUM655004]MDE0591090.1 lytic transglycosylase [Halocynthiibacter sp. C4]